MTVRQPIPFSAFTFGFLRLIRVQNLLIVVLTQFLARLFLVGPKAGHVFRYQYLALLEPLGFFRTHLVT